MRRLYMYNEYDCVIAKRKLSEKVLPGCVGYIVFVYQKPSEAYEVEFFDNNGETIDLLTVLPNDIELNV
jgi:hypothetical protein